MSNQLTILKLSPYCYPERISSSHLTDDLNDAFAKAGFKTIIYAPYPCRGIDNRTRKKYKKRKLEYICNGSVEIHRFPLFPEGSNPFGRAVRYIVCNTIQYFKGISEDDIDILFSGSTPPTQGLLFGLVKRKLSKKMGKTIPFIYSLQDVFPDSLVSTGLTTEGSILWHLGRMIENYSYSHADCIIVISSNIKDNLISKGVNSNKIQVIPNWVDVSTVKPIEKNDNRLFKELNLDKEKFYVVYAGNLGMAQGIDDLLSAADLLVNNDNIVFLIFGDGTNKSNYFEKCKSLPNVKMFPLMPFERVSEVYSLGDLCYVGCTLGTGKGAFPSKTYTIMATSSPILLSFDNDTELWETITEYNCGYCSTPGDVNKLVANILFAYNKPQELTTKASNALECVTKQYSKEACTKQYIDLVNRFIF